MKTHSVSTNFNFDGNVVVKNKISASQKHLFDLHKTKLDAMIKDMPFDLFVEQSKSKKTISLYTNVEGAAAYVVHKNKQNFEEIANFVISDAKQKSDLYRKQVKANEILDTGKVLFFNIMFGRFEEARAVEKQLAKIAVEDFDVYKSLPKINFVNTPLNIMTKAVLN